MFDFEREFGSAGLDDPAVDENVHDIGGEVVEDPLVVGDHEDAEVGAVGAHFGQAWHKQRRDPSDVERAWIRENLARVPMQLTAMLEARLRTSELVALQPGDVLSLGIRAEAPIELRVGETRKFTGRLTKHAGRVGVRIDRRSEAGISEA